MPRYPCFGVTVRLDKVLKMRTEGKYFTKSLAGSEIMLIFAPSNQISDTKSLLTEGSVFCAITSWNNPNRTAWGSGNTPKAEANLSLTARSAVSLLSNIKSN